MFRSSSTCFAAGLLLVGWHYACAPIGAIAAEESQVYQVGVAKVDITPGYPVRLNGFGNRRDESEGITQRIWAKALAIDEGDGNPIVLIAIDSLGIRQTMVDEVARRLSAKHGLARGRIAATFTHSHTTPKVTGACDTIFSSPIPPEHQANIDRYTAELTDWLEEVAVKALADRKPAKLSWAVGTVKFAMNRRTPGGPVDHDLPVLVVRSAEDDRIRAIYTTYACHCVTLSDNKISGDWAGFAQHAIEANHPGAIAMVSIGCGSDSNPNSGVTGGNYAAAADQGAQIAEEVERLLAGKQKPIAGSLAATFANIDLPLNPPPSKEELTERAKRPDTIGYNSVYQLARLERGEPLLTKIDYPVQAVSFGDSLSMVFLGGEICVDYALRLKQELDASRLWLHGYSNDFCSYIPSERLLKEGGYGGGGEIHYFALPNTLQAGLEERIIAEVHRQVPQQFKLNTDGERQSNARQRKLRRALQSIKVKDGFIVEAAAAEPLVSDPVAIDFGPDGRMWVAEMPDYTRFADEEFKPSGNVRVLIDREGDGRFDEASVFADGLRFPTDVKVWRDGVIVCDAPDVIYFEDADGDGKAEQSTVLLTGFATHNAQARVNSLRWGLDNWLYGSGGLFGGNITTHTGRKLALGERDFRFRPDTGEIEGVTGRTQQGRARNDWGDWFGCENGSLVDHYPLVDRYLARNPRIAPPATEAPVPVGSNPYELFPIGTPSILALSGPPGRPTSVCGLEIYRDELLGAKYSNNAFVAEPVNNLVHRRILSGKGSTFAGERAADEQDVEFLASTDPHFRPVQVRTGLDGCLYIVDMYREVIEHPKFIPEDTLRQMDVMGGREEGRIYRVRPRGAEPRSVGRLDRLTAEELAATIDSPNGPQRDLAHQILVQRQAIDAAPLLRELVQAAERPATRLQALCTLDGLGAVDVELLIRALADSNAAVRRHAIRLSEPLLKSSPSLTEAMLKLAGDADPQVKLQLAYTLGELDHPGAAEALAKLAVSAQNDSFLLAAVWSSVRPQNVALVARQVLEQAASEPLDEGIVDTAIRQLVVQGRPEDVVAAAQALSSTGDVASSWKFGAAARLLEHSRTDAAVGSKLTNQLAPIISLARKTLNDPAAEEQMKLAALRVVAASESNEEALISSVEGLLHPQSPPALQDAVVEALAHIGTPEAGRAILAPWKTYTSALRGTAFDAVLGRKAFVDLMLEQIAAGEVQASDLDALQRQRLLDHADETIRNRAQSMLAAAGGGDRQSIVDAYSAALASNGDIGRGRQLFDKHCSSCHILEGVGHAVGPDLAALSSREPRSLLQSIFDPNRDIDERFRSYTAVTLDGLSHAGILAGETSTSITLLEQQGKRHALLRADLELFENSGKSLMPEGLERDISPSDASDLIAYLSAARPEPKSIAGNEPVLISADYDGTLWLLASKAEIFGDQITYEEPFQNIGYWHGQNDYIAWSVNHKMGGAFDVYLHWACADDSAGNRFVVEGGEPALRGVAGATGGYDRFRTVHLGRLVLPAGESRIIVRPEGPLTRPHLMDLRGLYLVPSGASPERAIAGEAPTGGSDAATAVAKLLEGLSVGTPGEYERIPAIWREAIAAGRRNNAGELARVLDLSLPNEGEPLRDWQAVVIGGGVINGISQQGVWPRKRIAELLKPHPPMQDRWQRTIKLAVKMADDESVKTGTRYDALRILGADTWQRQGAKLLQYLGKDAHAELQMGAVSGLVDVDAPEAAKALAAAIPHLHEGNRRLAVQGMFRTQARRQVLAEAIQSGSIRGELLTGEEFRELAAEEGTKAQ
ncbi:MAG TPA: neutral/alkaline non-lysosomal ceramidase N-terminal domain-containing protein [Lacipirellula sp.]